MGAVRLELTKPEGEGFTVPCNCRYATPPEEEKRCWRKELNPQPSDYKSGALPIELLQLKKRDFITEERFSSQELFSADGKTAGRPWKSRDSLSLPDRTWAVNLRGVAFFNSQHFLYFCPDPQVQGSLRLGFCMTTSKM